MSDPTLDLPLRARASRALDDGFLRQALDIATTKFLALRREAFDDFPDGDALRERARAIKEATLQRLDHYLEQLVDRVEKDPNVRAVVFTGAHPERFVSHADVWWLQEGGAAVPSMSRRGASAVARTARGVDRARVLEPVTRRTPLWPVVEL